MFERPVLVMCRKNFCVKEARLGHRLGHRLGQKLIDEIVGENLRAHRIARGVSIDRLGSVLGTRGTQIANYESGTIRIPPSHLIEICRCLQVSLEDLFPRTDPDQDPQSH